MVDSRDGAAPGRHPDAVARRPTIRDVAAAAGVSAKTVSRVLNHESSVREDTRARVWAAIERLQFQKNEAAASLRRRVLPSGSVVAFVVTDFADPMVSMLARGAEQAGRERGSYVLVASSRDDVGAEAELLRVLIERRVDGLLVIPAPDDHSFLRSVLAQGPPIVFLRRPGTGYAADTVVAGEADGARAAVGHLAERAHRRIAFLASEGSDSFVVAERLRGYSEALGQHGLAQDDTIVRPGVAPAALDDVVGGLLHLTDPPTAILCADHPSTVAAVRALAACPAPRPAIVGFEDFELAELLDPSFTVVATDGAAMGRTAAELLFRRIDGDRRPAQHVTLQPTVVSPAAGSPSG